ncbi:MAG TPA: HEAT repeat domain-containing protein, partial [Blastocatellia bacterium]|nr:HEAT repeat domain-containing protein [Blastocatellia bacterium]
MPPPVRLAAARGLLPLTNEESLEALISLSSDESEEVRAAARASLDALDPASFLSLAADRAATAEVLGFLCL